MSAVRVWLLEGGDYLLVGPQDGPQKVKWVNRGDFAQGGDVDLAIADLEDTAKALRSMRDRLERHR